MTNYIAVCLTVTSINSIICPEEMQRGAELVSSQVEPQSAPQSPRVRSPNYPVLSLAEAVQKLRTVYEKEHMHPATREVVAKVLGYSGLNGASFGVVSALVKYGLMEQVGNQIKVSANGQDVLLHRKGDREYSEAVRRAALAPALFHELFELYGASLPSDHNLRVTLQKKGFNPKTVDSVIRVYRDTLAFVNAESDEVAGLPDEDGSLTSQRAQIPGQAVSQAPAVASISAVAVPTGNVIAFPFPQGGSVQIIFTGDVTQDVIDYVSEVLNVMKKAYPSKGYSVE